MMGSNVVWLSVLVVTVVTTFVSSRAVNISNTWMLPEEGFPVFYRYFRDRISWYEADAVCQFHHANLVTADSTSQYDAIRAYLKELDIAENIWIGLSRTTEVPTFHWRDFQPLNGEGHWQQPVPKDVQNICVAMDPAADFLWKPRICGGPDVASFICELPVPSWALGPKGCLLTELPSLTVLYIPEELSLELTSDCGLDGTKRIACKGDADRENMLKQLSCGMVPEEFEEKSTKPPMSLSEDTSNAKSTRSWAWTSNTIDIDYDMPTRHRRETEDTLSPSSTKSTTELLEKASSEDVTQNEASETTTEQSDESKTGSPVVEDTAEYPSAIAQGQLFGIIENGTMFDIIELNETTSEDVTSTHADPSPTDTVYTTVIYHKEPPSAANFVTKKTDKLKLPAAKKTSALSKIMSKEVEMLPGVPDSSIKLNRTFRKELPQQQNTLDGHQRRQHGNKTNQEVPNDAEGVSDSPTEPAEPEPEAQPRPNRQRQLTRPQRRSFYPYFFSRVLG